MRTKNCLLLNISEELSEEFNLHSCNGMKIKIKLLYLLVNYNLEVFVSDRKCGQLILSASIEIDRIIPAWNSNVSQLEYPCSVSGSNKRSCLTRLILTITRCE